MDVRAFGLLLPYILFLSLSWNELASVPAATRWP